ncbi:hypothetical protein O3P69_011188 [Scylla paramamosain]|uniref:Uncharacterized protein n=1 Tax=Scylla paramamosain TaxID=85552 RepID=A0AAW0ST19_SCYPA
MREASWRWWCLWWVCREALVAAAAAAACEVLDSGLQPTFPLPTTLTLRSLKRHWQLDFALIQNKPSSEACVRMEQQRSAVRLMLYRGRCKDGELLDYSFIEGMSVLPHAWTLLMVEVSDNKVLVAPSGAAPVPLRGRDGAPAPATTCRWRRRSTWRWPWRAASTARTTNYSSDPGKKKSILKSSQEEAVFYFHPSEDFVRLQYEVTCTTWLGQTIYPHVADIEPPSKSSRWYIVELLHLGGTAQVFLDYELLRSKDLPTRLCLPATPASAPCRWWRASSSASASPSSARRRAVVTRDAPAANTCVALRPVGDAAREHARPRCHPTPLPPRRAPAAPTLQPHARASTPCPCCTHSAPHPCL